MINSPYQMDCPRKLREHVQKWKVQSSEPRRMMALQQYVATALDFKHIDNRKTTLSVNYSPTKLLSCYLRISYAGGHGGGCVCERAQQCAPEFQVLRARLSQHTRPL